MTERPGPDNLSKAEIGKDVVQATAEAAATTVGEVVTILTGAIRDVATAVGGFATEVFETVEASRKALAEHADGTEPALDPVEATPEPDDPAAPV